MDRVIKFRGLRTDGKGWVYGDLWRQPLRFGSKCQIYVADGDEEIDDTGWVQVTHASVGQFTGRFDNKGNEIYEGDYVSCLNSGIADGFILWCPIECMFKFKWVSKTYSQVRRQSSYYTENGERLFSNTHLAWTVIGNIHEKEANNV